MKNKNKIWAALAVIVLLVVVGCYYRDSNKGKTVILTYDELQTKIENKEDFVYMMMMTGCPACQAMEEMMLEYFEDHNVTMYMLNLTNLPNETDEEIANRDAYFENYRTVTGSDGVYTPTFFVYKNGEIVDYKIGGMKDIEEFDKFVVKNQLDKKK